MSPLVGILIGAVLGAFLMWGVMEFIWRGKLIEKQDALDKSNEQVEQLTKQVADTAELQKVRNDLLAQRVEFERQLQEEKYRASESDRQHRKIEAEKFVLKSEVYNAEQAKKRAENEKTQLEGQLSRLQLEKAELQSEVDRLKYMLEHGLPAPSEDDGEE